MIIPALLTDKREKLTAMIDLCRVFTDYVQIDIMDGEFVPSRSITMEDLKSCSLKIGCEAHLMVVNPFLWLETFKKLGAKRIIYHYEIKQNHDKLISSIQDMGMEAGIALNPSTAVEQLNPFLEKIDAVLFMSVNPGFYGAPFIPGVLDKIKDFKSNHPKVQVEIDGGIKFDNVQKVAEAGVDGICVGSAILKSGDPSQAYKRLLELAHV